MEEEYYSNCCDAPPLTEVGSDGLGMCMSCREGAVFKEHKKIEKVSRKEALSVFDDTFSAFFGTKVYNKEKK